MNSSRPILYEWSGEAMVPRGGFRRVCDELFVIGETYRMEVIEERSAVSHSHFFASINESWKNLPEDLAERFPTAEHLRKYALIKSGYHDERSIVCSTNAEALRFAAFVKPMDEYAVVVVSAATVKVYTAQSQSKRAMDKEKFQASKVAVLELVSSMIGVSSAELQKNSASPQGTLPAKASAPALDAHAPASRQQGRGADDGGAR